MDNPNVNESLKKIRTLKKLNNAAIILSAIFVAIIIFFSIMAILTMFIPREEGSIIAVIFLISTLLFAIYGSCVGVLSLAAAIVILCYHALFGEKYEAKFIACGICAIFFILIPNCVLRKTINEIETANLNGTANQEMNQQYMNNNPQQPYMNANNYYNNYPQNGYNSQPGYGQQSSFYGYNNQPINQQPNPVNNGNNQEDLSAKIQQIHDLKEKGIITEEEFQQFKKSTLGM